MVILVSAIITTHNRLPLLQRAIQSVLTQTYQNMECIVVSDACDDGTEEYCSKRKDIKFVAISKLESKGGNYARNLGIKISKGKYVAFLDDDDYWLPTKIEKQVKLAEEKNCGFIYCQRCIEQITDGKTTYFEEESNSINTGDVSKKVLQSIFTTTSCILVKKDILLGNTLFDETLKFWQETELSIRIAQKTSFYCVPEFLIIYRVNTKDKNRLTNKFTPWLESVQYIFNKHKKLYKNLTQIEFLRYLALVWNDASYRAKIASSKGKAEMYGCLSEATQYLLNTNILRKKFLMYLPLLFPIIWYDIRKELALETKLLKISFKICQLIWSFYKKMKNFLI